MKILPKNLSGICEVCGSDRVLNDPDIQGILCLFCHDERQRQKQYAAYNREQRRSIDKFRDKFEKPYLEMIRQAESTLAAIIAYDSPDTKYGDPNMKEEGVTHERMVFRLKIRINTFYQCIKRTTKYDTSKRP